MLLWLSANGSTIIISLILIVLVYLAGKKLTKQKGNCCGNCSGCSGCCFHCFDEQEREKQEL
ncbi:FeoB-associated Cys-rich membrane protein [Lacrimispora aerotolerans]|jgi:hypothetical protein|uniref:FeoB-associated Cys-rich membrane protein n=1 Tax=Lacrimispora aerotolerans TaxID=36832 RepID=UPI00047AE903|nr:FeoB-associated Cys-rich membrane protein [Lacrimispora aerotolerans]